MSKSIFRTLVALNILLILATVVADVGTTSFLPPELQDFKRAAENAAFSPQMMLVIFFALSVLILIGIGLIGLLCLWSPARIIFTIGNLAGFPLIFGIGPIVYHPITEFFSALSMFVSGILWALIYFSPVKEYFERPPEAAAP